MWGMADFYFDDDGKLDPYYILNIRYPFIKKMHQFLSLNALKLIVKQRMEMDYVFQYSLITWDGSWLL